MITAALNSFKRAKQYYLTTILTLTLSLSMLLSVVSLVDLVYFAPLPYQDSEQLYLLEGKIDVKDFGAATNPQITEHIRKSSTFADELAIYHQWSDYKLYDKLKRPEVDVILASANLFDLLGVKPELGRLFDSTEQSGNKQPSAILGYRTWQQHYAGDPDIIGKKIQLNQRRFTVIGVSPDNLVLPGYRNINEAIWLPLDMDETFVANNSISFMGSYKAVVRLTGPVDLTALNSDMQRLAMEGAALYTPEVLKDLTVSAELSTFHEAIRGKSGNIVLLLLIGASLLMLIALINLSSMQVARAISRVKRLAISFAFGATTKALAVSCFKHNLSFISIAVLLALLLTSASFTVIETLATGSISRLDTLSINANILMVSGLLALGVAALYTAIELSVVKENHLVANLQSSGKGTGKQMSSGTSHSLIGLQVMFSFIVLLAASHVAVLTLSEAFRGNGVNTDNKWSLTVNYANITEQAERKNYHKAIVNQLPQIDAVNKVSAVSSPRIPSELNVNNVYGENNQYFASARVSSVGEGYFSMLDLAMVAGKSFNAGDAELENYPMIINQRLADLMDRDTQSLIGNKVSLDGKRFHTLVGVVANTQVPGDAAFESYEIFTPQAYWGSRRYSFLLDVQDAIGLHEQVSSLLQQVNSQLDIKALATLDSLFDEKRKLHLVAGSLALLVAVVSLFMVCIGINGIVNYMVHVRQYSMGVKLAMGASNKRLLQETLQSLMKPVIMSLVFAFSLCFFIYAYVQTQMVLSYSANWALTLALWLGLCVLALLVSFIPVRQILNRNPIQALRNE